MLNKFSLIMEGVKSNIESLNKFNTDIRNRLYDIDPKETNNETVDQLIENHNLIENKLNELDMLIRKSNKIMNFGNLFNNLRSNIKIYEGLKSRLKSDYFNIRTNPHPVISLIPYGSIYKPYIAIYIKDDNSIEVNMIHLEARKKIIDIRINNEGSELLFHSKISEVKDSMNSYLCLTFIHNVSKLIEIYINMPMNINEIDNMFIINTLGNRLDLNSVKTNSLPEEEYNFENMVKAFLYLAMIKDIEYNCSKS